MPQSAVPPPTIRAYVAFGANLGDPTAAFRRAGTAIAALPGTRLVRRSSLYRSAPVGVVGQPDYINAVFEIETHLAAAPLLDALQTIETSAGRTRETRFAPRTLDLDLLLYADQRIDSPRLQVPHPRMHERAFVLVPLHEIAPDAVVPGQGAIAALLRSVANQRIERIG